MMRSSLTATMAGVLLMVHAAPRGADADEGRPDWVLSDKTLVAWVTLANLTQRGGSVLSLESVPHEFEAIVFGELQPRTWMAGSAFFRRTQQEQSGYPEEMADSDTLVQIAITYEGQHITVYRDGGKCADYASASEPAVFTPGSIVLMGLRHRGAANGYFAGTIEDARIYDSALDAETIAALRPNEPGGPAPLGWWTFEDGSTRDRMGTFPAGEFLGGARIAEGRLLLDGTSGCMIVRRSPALARAAEGWPRYHVAALSDEGVCVPYDPNGCIYWKGKYHLMYIFQRADGAHCWGHLSSPDLIHWTYHPTALQPGPGDADRGTFSGNAFVSKDGVPMLCWFGIDAGVCVATAQDADLIRWQKHLANPIIPIPQPGDPGHGVYTVWDPYLWLEGDAYHCLLGGNRLPNGRDTLYLCTSPDLVHWTPQHAFYEGDPSWREPDEDCSCPDFFRLGRKHVLLCISHAIGARFYVGRLRGDVFHPEQHVRLNWRGGMFFAPESLEDGRGRRVLWAWVTDPRVGPAQQATGSGFMSLPRVLSLGEDATPLITPAEELQVLRRKHHQARDIRLSAGTEVALERIRGAHLELAVEIDPGEAQAVGVKVRCSPDGQEETGIWCDLAARTLRLDMSRSTLRDDVTYGSPPFTSYGLQRAADNANSYHTVEAPFAPREGEVLRLRVFVDGPVLEVFANDRQCLTQVIYPKRADSVLVKLCSQGGSALVRSVDAWEMAALTFSDRRQEQ